MRKVRTFKRIRPIAPKAFKKHWDMCRWYYTFKPIRNSHWFWLRDYVRRHKLHKMDVFRMRTGRAYCCSMVWDGTDVIKYKRNRYALV